MNNILFEPVQNLAKLTMHAIEGQLNTAWKWKDYENEGIRFGHFRVMEELQALAVRLHQVRPAPPTPAQNILAQYHAGFRDLQAVLLGIEDKTGGETPGEEQWTIQNTLRHITQADMAFYATLAYGLEKIRAGEPAEAGPKDEDYDRLLAKTEDEWNAMSELPISGLLAELDGIHTTILAQFAGISDAELDQDVYYWESEPYSIRFRLHRFTSHMTQHTIQTENIITSLGKAPNEAKQIHRKIFGALALVENTGIGVPAFGEADQAAFAATISGWTDEFAAALLQE